MLPPPGYNLEEVASMILSEIRGTAADYLADQAVTYASTGPEATGKLIADADVTFAVIDTATGRAVPLAGELRAVFAGAPGDETE